MGVADAFFTNELQTNRIHRIVSWLKGGEMWVCNPGSAAN